MNQMISILGFKRVLILAVLLGINAVFGAAVYYDLLPRKDMLQQQLSQAKGKLSTTQDDIEKMRVEFDQLTRQVGEFNRLKASGFLGAQGRRQAEIIFGDIQRDSGVVSAVANVRAASIQTDETAAKAGYAVLVSPIDIEVQAMDDTYINRYLSLLFARLPGYVSIDSVTMNRVQDVSGPVLRAIVNGQNVAMISAKITMSWRTMVSQADVDRGNAASQSVQPVDSGAQGGGQP